MLLAPQTLEENVSLAVRRVPGVEEVAVVVIFCFWDDEDPIEVGSLLHLDSRE